MLPVGFEPTIPASERPQNHGQVPAASGTGIQSIEECDIIELMVIVRLILRLKFDRLCSPVTLSAAYGARGQVLYRCYIEGNSTCFMWESIAFRSACSVVGGTAVAQ